MQQNEKVSVIIPVYNVTKYISKCIESILNQTYTDFELILVNDGSTDNSPEICREYEKRDSRIIVIDKINEGAGMARNAGLDVADGKYIMFIDSDDWVENNMLEYLVDLLKNASAEVAICNYFTELPDGSGQIVVPIQIEGDTYTTNDITKYIAILDDENKFPYLWNRLYLREIIEKNSIRFEKRFVTGQDLDFNLKYFRCVNTCVLSNTPLYHYIKHGTGSLCARFKNNLYEIVSELNGRREDMYREFSMIENSEYKTILGKTYVRYVGSCIPNMFRPDAPYKTKDRRRLLKQIFDDRKLREYCKTYVPENRISSIFKLVVTLNNVTFALTVYTILFTVRNNFSGIYKKLRGN